MDASKLLEGASQGVAIGTGAFAALSFLARTVGRPIIYGVLNGRYQTKIEAVAAHGTLVDKLDEMRDDVKEIRQVLMR